MALLASYHLPGLAVEDHAIDVPLDWRGTAPAKLAGAQGAPTSALAEESAAEKCDPAFEGRDHYPIIRPDLGRDFTFHFAVGLPF